MSPSKKGAPRALPKSYQFKGVPMGFAAAGFPALIAASIVLSALAPADVTLGSWVKLVYWHGMYTWACIVLFSIGAILAAWYLASVWPPLARYQAARMAPIENRTMHAQVYMPCQYTSLTQLPSVTSAGASAESTMLAAMSAGKPAAANPMGTPLNWKLLGSALGAPFFDGPIAAYDSSASLASTTASATCRSVMRLSIASFCKRRNASDSESPFVMSRPFARSTARRVASRSSSPATSSSSARDSANRETATYIAGRMSRLVNGLTRYAIAPASHAWRTYDVCENAVTITTGAMR